MTASSEKEVERVLISQNAMPLRNIVITQRGVSILFAHKTI